MNLTLKEEAMKLISSLLGRRQFLIAFVSSAITLAFGRVAKAFNFLFKERVASASATSESSKTKPIKGIVVYYSATGNTAQVAGAIYRGMKSIIACDVAPIKKVKPADMAKYDVMAIGAPNWYMRVPANVYVFTHDMPRMDGKHCIIFGTHGGDPVSQFWALSKNILKKGMTIIGWSDWYGSDLIQGGQPDGEWGHPDEIDLAEAEAFGRRMAEYSIRIYAGDKTIIPEIPTPDKGQAGMWSPRVNELGNITFAGPPPNSIPEFDFSKCIYPRCTQCIENCPVHAIDFSVVTTASSIVDGASTGYPLVLKEACEHCGGLCERVCHYDAITYAGEEYQKVINMKKCTYPKCTVCLDHCPQDAIDFSVNPPVFHNWCENGDYICFDVCPQNAIEYINHDVIHWWARGMNFTPPEGTSRTGAGDDEASYWKSHYAANFRPRIRLKDMGSLGSLMNFTIYPRVQMREELWPYRITSLNLSEQGNSTLGQPQPGQPQRRSSLNQGLEGLSLPTGTITGNDMPKIVTIIRQVLDKISESTVSNEKRADYQTIKSGILSFQDWLKQQGCITEVSAPYDLEATDKYSKTIFWTYPGQLPFDIVFNMGGDIKKQYRLLIFVSEVDLLDFANLVENEGLPIPFEDFYKGRKGL